MNPGKQPTDAIHKQDENNFTSQILDRLVAEDNIQEDSTIIYLSKSKMNQLNLFKGESMLLEGKYGKQTVGIILSDDDLDSEKIRLNKVIRKNLLIELGDLVIIKPLDQVPALTKIHVLPFDDSVEGIKGDLTTTYLIPYFKETYRPVKKGNYFVCGHGLKTVEFKIVETEPDDIGIVGPTTTLCTEGEPIKREDEEI